MRTVMQEEPVDPSLEILKDEKSWYSERRSNMNNLKCKLLKALMGVSLGALGAFVVTFVVYFWNLDMKLTSVMEGILLKHYDKIDRDQHL